MAIGNTKLLAPRLRLFIVEDNPIDQSMYIRWIRHTTPIPIDIQEMESGEEALKAWKRSPPHCILLDFQLPDMTGLDFLEKMKTIPSWSEVPIIFLTGQGNEKVATQAIKQGAHDYFIKNSLSEEILWHHIEQAINQNTTVRRLEALERQSSTILQSSRDGLIVVGADGLFRFSNPAAEHLLRQTTEELLGSPFGYPIFQEETREITLHHSGGPTTPVEMRVVPIEWENESAYLICLRDLTERRKAEEDQKRHEMERQYAQKLESLGVLAGGIAHDFNNLLMTVVARAGLAIRSLPKEDPAREHLRFIEKAGLRGGELANQMLTFAGQTQLNFQSVDCSLLLKEMKSIIRSAVSKKISVTIETATKLPPIRGDRAQLRQMVMNITINAAEAIGDRGGSIIITAEALDSSTQDFRPFHIIGDLPWGPCVSVRISDTGSGIKPELIPKIFDPFFTTKFPGRGLGLAAILGIIRAHGGALAVRSQVGKGTEFWFLFPSSQKTPTPRSTTLTIPQQAQGHSQASPTMILIVDDEKDVLEACSLILREMGLETLVASDGPSGLQLFKQYERHLAFVLVDLTMPHMDGGMLCKEIRLLNAHVPILVSSGYTECEAMKHFAGLKIASFIQKPFQVEVLIDKVQQLTKAMDSPPAT
ncbi:MAG: response regulator [Nitrospirales bacterium]